MHSFSFAPMPYKGSFCNIPSSDPSKLQVSMNASWQFFNYVGGAGTDTATPTVIRNPVSQSSLSMSRTTGLRVANCMPKLNVVMQFGNVNFQFLPVHQILVH